MPAHSKTARELLEVTTLLMRSFTARMRQGEQRVEPAHIGILARLSMGPCTLTELAQHQAVRLPTMSKSVALLVVRGWVERSTPAENRRQTMVALTAAGRGVFAEMKRGSTKHVAGLLVTLSDEDRMRVDAGLAILIKALTEAVRNERG
jgi:DNA-binding MarR family transcriptional regulator